MHFWQTGSVKAQLIIKCLIEIFNLKSNYFRSFFGRTDDTKKTFQNELTFKVNHKMALFKFILYQLSVMREGEKLWGASGNGGHNLPTPGLNRVN